MMGLASQFGRTMVLAPHPDDEVLGCGGVLAALADAGCETHVVIATIGQPPAYPAEQVAALRQEAARAHEILAVTKVHWLDLPAARLDTVAHADLNAAIGAAVSRVAPETLLLPFPGDIHRDHQLLFESALVASRPAGPSYPRRILAYETLSETNWNAPGLTPGFTPTSFVDIRATLQRKLDAFAAYGSQVRSFPAERSVDALEALARLRGATVHRHAAEAFVMVREVL